jgi:orotate phosphoribosyltransferase
VDSNRVLELFRSTGAMLEGHFELSSGLHSERYFQCALLLEDPGRAEILARALAEKIRKRDPARYDAVIGPALGAVIWAHEVARALGARCQFTERKDGRMELRRGFRIAPSDRVLVVEDVVTTGGSTRETIDVARQAGATVVGAASIVDRSSERAALGVPYHALLRMTLPTYEPASCPLCAQGLPVVKPGSRS